ncbi:MAG: hypothetical protein AB9834_10775 [Lentimicrobium sp.]
MEIGSFLELDIRHTDEYYSGSENVARLNSARSGIYHAMRLYDSSVIYLPHYLCSSVESFLKKKGVVIKKYFINDQFEPQVDHVEPEAAILIVNYFGILSKSYISKITDKFVKVIVDNCPSFYSEPLEGCYNVYSTRKFFGVPDGGYVIGKNAGRYMEEYQSDFSSETSLFLLKRHEAGCNASYAERMKNEERIDASDILKMSGLTRMLLSGIDYEHIKKKRQENFRFACGIYRKINLIDPLLQIDENSVPMVYPLVIKDATLVDSLREKQIFTGRWWKHVLAEVPESSFEALMSGFMIPVPIDQRYGTNELEYVAANIFDRVL